MIALIWTTFSLLAATVNESKAYSIAINSSMQLETLLCRNITFTGDTAIMLDSTILHIIQHEGFCIVSAVNNASVTISSRSDHQYALINCKNGPNNLGTAGFYFWNLNNISLIRLVFTNCGASLQKLPPEVLNSIDSSSSRLQFSPHHGAVLLINGVNTNIVQVNITKYFGFAMVGTNIQSGIIHSVNIFQNNNFDLLSWGSGMLLLYQELRRNVHNETHMKVAISQSIFEDNHITYKSATCPPTEYGKPNSSKAIVNGPALTVIYSQSSSFIASTVVSKCTFVNNSGHPIGSVLMMNFNRLPNSQFIVDNCSFIGTASNQREYCGGLLLYVYICNFQAENANSKIYIPVKVSKSFFHPMFTSENFMQNSAIKLMFQNVNHQILIELKGLRFAQKEIGVLVQAANIQDSERFLSKQRTVEIIIEGIIAVALIDPRPVLSETGSFQFYNIRSILINGSMQYPVILQHILGPIIKAVNTDVILQGTVYFGSSTSRNGAGINIDNGILSLKSGLMSYFGHLRAYKKGGAIYISSNSLTLEGGKMCSLQISGNASATFIGNRAIEAGSSAFVTNLYNCYMGDTWINESTLVYKNTFNFTEIIDKNIRNVSTTSKKIYICKDFDSNKEHYPGEEITFGVITTDFRNHSVFSKIYLLIAACLYSHNYGFETYWKLAIQDQQKIIQESVDNNCTLVSVKILRNMKGCAGDDTEIEILTGESINIRIPINLNKHCPTGFQINNITLSCDCSGLFTQVTKLFDNSIAPVCNITARTLSFITQVAWVGTNNDMTFTMSLYCNTDHCNTIPKSYHFKVENETTFITDRISTFEICQGSRTGTLCSECIQNGSALFGSTDCAQCSNWWILTVLLYAIAGPLLVYLLFVLKLTLAKGTLNGILTYAHLSNGGLLYKLRQQQIYSSNQKTVEILAKFCHVFLSMLNLNIGFPLCFYNGMNEVWKSGLSLLFPLYLLVIVIGLIMASRYSSWLSNRISDSSVQVLVTVIHLSFSKLLLALTDVLSSTVVYVGSVDNSYRVWLNDGNVSFGSGQHLVLILLTFVIVCVFIVPYAVVLTAGVFLMKHKCIRKYLRPYYEAIHGPYKSNRKYWFVLRNLLVVIAIMMFVVFGGNDQFANSTVNMATLLIYITAQTYAKPFKSKVINLLDTIILLNYGVIIATTWYFYLTKEIWKSKVIMITMVMLFFLLFVGVVICHILAAIKSKCPLLKSISCFSWDKKNPIKPPKLNSEDDEFREPLCVLEPTNCANH